MSLEVKIEGLAKLREAFEQAPLIVGGELEKTVKNAGLRLQRIARIEAPHRTGMLQRSIYLEYRPIEVSVFTVLDYAPFVHFGTKSHWIFPKKKKALYWEEAMHPVRAVLHPGTKPNPFFERAIESEKDYVQNLFDECLKRIINKLGNIV